jgi:hypothetical protein
VATELAVRTWRPSPDPGCRVAIELSGGDTRDVGDIVGVGQRHAGEGRATEEAPPAFDEIEPGGADGNERLVDARMVRKPVPNRSTQVAGQVVGDEGEIALRIGVVEGL